MTMIANPEGGVRVVIANCEAASSPIQRHREELAADFYVGLRRAPPSAEDGDEVDVELAYAYTEIVPPTAAAVGKSHRFRPPTPANGLSKCEFGSRGGVVPQFHAFDTNLVARDRYASKIPGRLPSGLPFYVKTGLCGVVLKT